MSFKITKDLVCYFCAGARNHSLLDFFSEEKMFPEYDERMASFKALGHTKISGKPAVICTTSGTAVSETVSALLEAKYSNLPLVLISGDRPRKMHGTGAPQTISHSDITKLNVGTFIEIPIEELATLEIEHPIYPIHINVLINDTKDHELKTEIGLNLNDFREFTQNIKRPLFLVSHENNSLRSLVKKLIDLNVCVYAEVLSSAHDLTKNLTENELIKMLSQFDSIIRIGHTPLSKIWRLLENHHLPIFSFDERNLPGLSYGKVAPLSATHLGSEFFSIIDKFTNTNVFNTDSKLEKLIEKYPQSEFAHLRDVSHFLPEDSIVYLGNSLSIRYFEMVQNKKFSLYGARGINGIDGQISQSIGMAQATNDHVYSIIGDITAQYDLNSLRHLPPNLTLIIINNKGGRIFETLNLSPVMIMEHEFDFRKVAQAFGVSYSNSLSSCQIIELMPLKLETQKFLNEWKS